MTAATPDARRLRQPRASMAPRARLAAGLLGSLAVFAAPAPPAAAAQPAGDAPSAAAGPQVQAGAIELRPFKARYAFYWHGMQAGVITFTLKHTGGTAWVYESVTEPRGLFHLVPGAAVRISSRMVVDADGVRPLHFEGVEGSDTSPAALLDFDWQAMRVRGHMKEQKIDMALRPGVQDDLSVMISLLHSLEQGAVPQGISLFDKGGIRDYDYSREGEDTVATPFGQVAAEIYRSQKKLSPRRNLYWLAPAYGDVPVRAEQRRGEDLEWRMEIEQLDRPAGP